MWELIFSLLFWDIEKPNISIEKKSPVHMLIDPAYAHVPQINFEHTLPLAGVKPDAQVTVPIKKDPNNLGLEITGRSALLFDFDSMTVLWSKNPDQVAPIASISKLLTALVIIDQEPNWEEGIVYRNDLPVLEGYRYIFKGERISRKDLFYTALIGSDNTALTVLVDSLGMEDGAFIQAMNDKAKQIGMESASFEEITGLSNQNRASANDIARLLKNAYADEMLRDVMVRPEYIFYTQNTGAFRRVYNTNELLGSFINEEPYQIELGKTGFINEAGYCVSSIVSHADYGSHIAGIVLGSESNEARFQELKSMIVWGFDNYSWE